VSRSAAEAAQPNDLKETGVRDPRIEQWLESEGIHFSYEELVDLGEFDVEASKQNQARVNAPLIEDLVERYTLALIDGADLPAMLGKRREKDNRIVLLDGNQRLAAHLEAERTATDVYIVRNIDEAQEVALCWTANTLNGDAGTPLDRMLLAKHFHRRFPGFPNNEVARRFKIKPTTFNNALREDEVVSKLSGFGLDPDSISNPNKSHLHVYINNDVQFREAAKLIQEAGLVGQLANEFWADIRRARSEGQVMEVIEAWRERPEVQDAIRRKRLHRPFIPKSKVKEALDKMNALIRHLERYPDPISLEIVSREELNELLTRHKYLGTRLVGYLKLFDARAA
jgi:hypothetical protein